MVGNRHLAITLAGVITLLTLVWIAVEMLFFVESDRSFLSFSLTEIGLSSGLAACLALLLHRYQRQLVWDHRPLQNPLRLPLLTALAFLVTLVASSLLVHLNHGQQINAKRTSTITLAASMAQSLTNVFNQAQTTTTALAYLVQENQGRLSQFQQHAAGLLTSNPAISNLQLAPGGVVRQIYPRGRHEAALGHDLLQDPARKEAALKAIQSQAMTLDGPLELIQGGMGVILRQPVFIDQPGEGRFWGFTIALITLDDLLEQAGLESPQYAWSLYNIGPDDDYRPIAGSEQQPGPNPVRYSLSVPNGRWMLNLSPLSGWILRNELWHGALLVLASTLFITLLVFNGLRYPLQLSRELDDRTRDLNNERLLLRQTEAISRTGSWSHDRRERHLLWSEEVYEILRIPRDVKPSPALVLARIHPQDHASVRQAWRGLVFGHHYEIEYRIQQQGQPEQTLWLRETAVVERNGDPHVRKAIGATQDVTRRKELELKLRTLCQAVAYSPAATLVTTVEPRVTYVNPRYTEMTGYALEELEGREPSFWKAANNPPADREQIRQTLAAGRSWQGELWHRKKDGTPILLKVAISPVRNDGKITHYVAIKEDITEKRQMERTIWRQANFDHLTGLANRSHFADRCEIAIDRARRHQERVLLLYLDLNRFKPINDRYGHKAGDTVLKEFAARLHDHIRSSDIAARMGGDEFTVLLEDLPTDQPVERLIDVLHGHLIQPPYCLYPDENDEGVIVELGVSIGHALYPEHGDAPEQLLSHADRTMYRQKLKRELR